MVIYMEYMSTWEAAVKWGVSLRYVQRLLHENRILEAKKNSGTWLIPCDAKKPIDPRKTGNRREPGYSQYHYLPFIPLSKKNPDAVIDSFQKYIKICV